MGFGKSIIRLKPSNIKRFSKPALHVLWKVLDLYSLGQERFPNANPDELLAKNLCDVALEFASANGCSELHFPLFYDNKDQETIFSRKLVAPRCINHKVKDIPDFGTVYAGGFPSITTILNHTRPASATQEFERGLVEPHLYELSEHLDSSFHQFLPHWLVHFRTHHAFKRKIPFALQQLQKRNIEADNKFLLTLNSFIAHVPHLNFMKAYESFVVHPWLGYAGKVDWVGQYKLIHAVIEWKVVDEYRAGLDHQADSPVQAVAYAGAVNYNDNYPHLQIPIIGIGVVYTDGRPGIVYEIDNADCDDLWVEWLNRLVRFKKKFPLLYPVRNDYGSNPMDIFNVRIANEDFQ